MGVNIEITASKVLSGANSTHPHQRRQDIQVHKAHGKNEMEEADVYVHTHANVYIYIYKYVYIYIHIYLHKLRTYMRMYMNIHVNLSIYGARHTWRPRRSGALLRVTNC